MRGCFHRSRFKVILVDRQKVKDPGKLDLEFAVALEFVNGNLQNALCRVNYACLDAVRRRRKGTYRREKLLARIGVCFVSLR
ncbi:hypothetical protein [Ollibium composti]|jgi:hypothetical protein|uniref:hypothetical protein n=1 Tax=Ollibium composti TaxID=2675109 RepID=UPI001454DA6D|nr:hypothetical protein [Mesorhizobium composti]